MVVVEVRQGTLGGDGRGWGPAGNTGRGWSWLRSGREHWAWMVVVEVRQGTLGGDGRGWGPAGNTGRGWSCLRSGREHWAWMVVVEVRQGTLGVDGRGWGPAGEHCGSRVAVEQEDEEDNERRRTTRGGGEERQEEEDQATDIKSNNPHLAGGESDHPRAPIQFQVQNGGSRCDSESTKITCFIYAISYGILRRFNMFQRCFTLLLFRPFFERTRLGALDDLHHCRGRNMSTQSPELHRGLCLWFDYTKIVPYHGIYRIHNYILSNHAEPFWLS